MNFWATTVMLTGDADRVALSTVLTVTAVACGGILAAHLIFVLATNRRLDNAGPRHWVSLALHLAFLSVMAVLAISSFGTLVTTGHLLGYPLLLHLMAAGAFVFLLLGFASVYLPQGTPQPNAPVMNAHRWWLNRWSVWAIVLGSLITAGTMFLSMFPILDTAGLLRAARLHRYAGLFTVVAAIVHAYSLICVRFRWR